VLPYLSPRSIALTKRNTIAFGECMVDRPYSPK
jgi:hypothetical protein